MPSSETPSQTVSETPAAVARAASARSLLTEATISGIVPLCRLTDAEEILLGGAFWALANADVMTAWSQVEPDRQQANLVGARRALVARGLAAVTACRESPTDELVPSAALGLVIAARQHAAYVVLAGGPADGPVSGPRLYALADQDGLQGLVVEVVAGGQHDYRLASPELAARGLASWAVRHVRDAAPAARVPAVAVEVLRHRAGEALTMGGAVVTAPSGLLTLARRDFDGATERTVAVGDTEVETALLDLLLSAAEPTPTTARR